jgi:hypothetical protein
VQGVGAECLDWLLVLGRGYLELVLRIYIQHFNQHRPHQALGLEPPGPSAGLTLVGEARRARVRRRDLLGGVLHEYQRAAYRIYAPYGLLASYIRLSGIRPDGSDVRLAAYAIDDSFGKRGPWSDISTNYDNQLRA